MTKIKIFPKKTILYISHGGGPLPLLGDSAHKELVNCLLRIANLIPKPKAIIVISAHWEEAQPTITNCKAPQLIYDYYGFPPESYQIKYPAAGAPTLAERIKNVLNRQNLNAALSDTRGFDHGLFVPLKIMYPDADIPCVQVSLVKGLNPEIHIQMGEALSDLDEEDLLIIGSGFSFHNMHAFFAANTSSSMAMNEAFEDWLSETCTSRHLSESERRNRLIRWEASPGARYCHPREEHLLPLHVCYGAAQKASDQHFRLDILHKQASMYLWTH